MEPGPRMKRNSPSVSITSVVAEGTISGIPSHLEGTPEKPKPKSVNQSSVEQWSGGVIVTEDFYGKKYRLQIDFGEQPYHELEALQESCKRDFQIRSHSRALWLFSNG